MAAATADLIRVLMEFLDVRRSFFCSSLFFKNLNEDVVGFHLPLLQTVAPPISVVWPI